MSAHALDWPALMRLGMVELGLAPDTFWALTPAELVLLAGGGSAAAQAMSRDELGALMNRFPDRPKASAGGAPDTCGNERDEP